MKRTYIAPEALVIKMTTEDAILSLSLFSGELSAGGGDNVQIKPSDEEYNGSFQSNRFEWNSEEE